MKEVTALPAAGDYSLLITIVIMAIILVAFVLFRRRRGALARKDSNPKTAFLTPETVHGVKLSELDVFNDTAVAVRLLRSLTLPLGDRFSLTHLYQLFNQKNVIHPHITIRTLRDAGYLIRSNSEFFCWKSE